MNQTQFLSFSAAVTGFSVFDLQGTGVAQTYWETVQQNVSKEQLSALLLTWQSIEAESKGNPAVTERLLRQRVFSVDGLGNLARKIVKMWYSGNWYGPTGTSVISAQTYVEGLLWPAMNTHPKGAKQPGFGTWHEPPTQQI